MSYEGLVEAGRAAREQADNMQWVEGDLALQVEILPPTERPRDPETGDFLADEVKALKRYAEDVGVPYSTMQRYRSTSAAWPVAARRPAPWAVHKVLAAQDDRFSLITDGMTYRQAEKLIRDRTAGSRGKPGWHELLGRVGDDLIAAEKHLSAAEVAISNPDRRSEPDDRLRAKARRYAIQASLISQRLEALTVSVPVLVFSDE